MLAVNGRPVSSITSRARTIRRPLLGRMAAAAAGQPGVQLGRAQIGELGLEADAGTVVRSGKMEIVESGTDVQA
jgi:hypothetical protein